MNLESHGGFLEEERPSDSVCQLSAPTSPGPALLARLG